MQENRLQASIVIATYNRANLLKLCLQSLVEQSADKSLYEVIVVNNSSTDRTQEVAGSFASRYHNLKVVVEFRQGASFARNRGFQEARANWVAYLDDDARAHPNYVERLLYVIRNYDFDGFGGVFLPWYKYGKTRWFKDYYGSNAGNVLETGEIPKHLYINGANCAFRKTVLEQLGGFPSNLGPKGDRFSYGEETLLQVRMRREGKILGFDPKLIVDHVVMPHKLMVRWFFKSAFIHGKDFWHIFQLKPTVFRIIRSAFSMIGSPVFYFPKTSYRLFRPDYYFQNFCIDLFCPAFGALGKIYGAFRSINEGVFHGESSSDHSLCL